MATTGNYSIPSRTRSGLGKTATIVAVACMIGVLFAGSTIATPLYVIYKQQFGFSQITLTLIYAAWLAELIDDKERSRATVIATMANFTGLGVGALVAGMLAEYVAQPLRTPFVAYLAALVVVAALLAFARETVARPQGIAGISVRPRAGVPASIRSRFVAPAVTGFGAMALVAFFAALAPSVLALDLHETSHAVAGAIFLELAAVVALIIALTRTLSSRTAMLWSLGLMLPSLALLVTAQLTQSMAAMVAATAVCGMAAGLGYRGSLQVVNQIAPDDRRAEVISTYFICCFLGNALPVIGIGVLSSLTSSTVASLVFAVTIAAFAVIALVFGLKYEAT
ncbi:MFS transporter [Bradyrhizobium betae]|uniref:MFS transporter n=1 Tax=Bradyrhizobium betae TaxID=244734 RepID=A0A4Q1VGU5_9BRAD|nr:MFS transporter [Bradyrhizobium betae]RXT50430.1 hypothetical protein B5V03_07795 [Bradyrhizobium betae]